MTIRSTSHYKHLQHFWADSIDEQPEFSDKGDIFHLFTEDDNIVDYIFTGTKWILDNETPSENISVTSTVNPPNLDISLTTHKNSILGTGSKTLTDLFNDLEIIKNIDFGLGDGSTLADIVTELTTLAGSKNLSDLNTAISTLQSALTTTKKIDDLYTILNTIYANKTLSDVNTSIVNLEGSGNKTLTDVVTQLTTMSNSKTLADIVTKLDELKTEIDLIKNTDGIKKITDGIVNKNTSGTEIFTDANAGSVKLTGSNVSQVVTIPSGETGLSGAVNLTGFQILQFQMPATWVTANLTFQTSDAEGGTYQNLYDDAGLEVTVVVSAQARNISIDINSLKLAGLTWVKFRSGTSGTPVNQTAERTIKVIGKV